MLTVLRVTGPLLLLWMGVRSVVGGSMTLGTMLALNALAASCLAPISQMVSNGRQLHLVGAQLGRVMEVFGTAPEDDSAMLNAAPQLKGRIDLRNVSFRHAPGAREVLRDVSLSVEPGQKLAIVGATGSGKSTLVRVLLGLYRPSEGESFYDGIPFERWNPKALRRQCGVVLQESDIFNGTIRENIAFCDPSLPATRVVEAARLAGLHDDVMQMPLGYDTWVAESGKGLSGGQRQRLAIARALAHHPAILVLDEATSHLDANTEALVDGNLSALACTRVVVAHRLSAVRNADSIVVLDQGQIVERGSHEQLIAANGHYARLLRGQREGGRSSAVQATNSDDVRSALV